jgi:hypothetical protein
VANYGSYTLKGVLFQRGYFMPLTDTEVQKSKPADKPYRLCDANSLFLWVTPAGGKLWRWAYEFEGREKLMSSGKHPMVTLAEARERRDESRKMLANGIDPMAKRKQEKTDKRAQTEGSFQNIASLWLEHWAEGKSPRHVEYTRRRMEMDILPVLGKRPLAEIEAPELVAMTKAIEDLGARDIAKRALKTAGQVFRYAIAHGYARRKPATEIRPRDILKSSRKTNYARVEAKELPALLRAIEVYQGTHVTRLLDVQEVSHEEIQPYISLGA